MYESVESFNSPLVHRQKQEYARTVRRNKKELTEFDSSTKSFRIESSSPSMTTLEEAKPLLEVKITEPEENEEKFTAWEKFKRFITGAHTYRARTIRLDRPNNEKYSPNVVRNQKYTVYNFVPLVLYEQFKFFFNLYFLVVALTQFIPVLKVGFLFTYVAPLAFVLLATMAKEAWDDIKRFLRDREANSQLYPKLTAQGIIEIPSSKIRVGDLIVLETDQRVPADMVFLRTSEKNGSCFIRTDQLDGETDWKLRRTVAFTQKLAGEDQIVGMEASVYAEKPKKDIYNFVGNFMKEGTNSDIESLSVENVLWTNTVVASGRVIGLVMYTGKDTRSVMNTSTPSSKVGRLDLEINQLSKVLCVLLLALSFVMTALKGFHGIWYIYFFRFMLLFSAIIPISLRVNLDMAKTVYSFFIMRDKLIPGTVVRTSTIPEELGRVQYLLSDKTGTLTQNDMIFKKLHLGSMSFSKDTLEEVKSHLENSYEEEKARAKKAKEHVAKPNRSPKLSNVKIRKTITTRARDALKAIALCHNVTPVNDTETKKVSYQASSPDEIALVKFAESVNLKLAQRDVATITLENPFQQLEEYEVLNIFPFTSESKRMGIIVKDKTSGAITFYMKGADVVMTKIVKYNDWLDEECGNMAREGLRTLVFGKRDMKEEEYEQFLTRYTEAKTSISNRNVYVQRAIESIESELELLCLTGVEDKLQENVKPTLEMLANAGIRVWMLTGDKVETAKCIAVSARLVSRGQNMYTIMVKSKDEAAQELTKFANLIDTCLVIDGASLQICMQYFQQQLINVACRAPCVVCCRCSPTQKAEVVRLIKMYKKAVTCAIGDGGNDVSMIQAADVGVGIVGKEGKQASLAADFSITQFSYISRLLIWHGRNSYKRSANLGQFIFHRGIIISFIQAVFSAIFYFAAVSVYNGFLLVGYATIYTMAPVFSLVMDEDVKDEIAFRFPELYSELQLGRSLSYKTFCIWLFSSVYQAGVIMLVALFLFENSLINIVSITFTALILTELLNVAFEIHRWNWYMALSEVVTVIIYGVSMVILKTTFDMSFILTWDFVWKLAVVTFTATVPLFLIRCIRRRISPPSYLKLS
eukprot:TRINITY_DN4154_c0_g1_i1.p1 TRINITY_DN4154_c0_g1~~TRINITY_DN4154_c0_g1_i1.p1  ORF type:complete len:1093 (+),score=239.76 TRINITY_DN4154_c0_g1_i1:78-3356(+)